MFIDTMTWPQVIESILKEFRISTYELHNKYGLNSATISNIRKGKSLPSQKIIKDIEQALNIIINDTDPENITYRRVSEEPAQEHVYHKEDFLDSLLPVGVVAYVHAGETGPVFSEDVLETIYLVKGPGMGKLHALRVLGDSMAPTINEGDNIVVSLDTQAFDGDVALIAYNNHDYILKRVYFNDDRDIVTIVSDNSKYPPAILHISKIKSILPVVYHTRGRNSLRIK